MRKFVIRVICLCFVWIVFFGQKNMTRLIGFNEASAETIDVRLRNELIMSYNRAKELSGLSSFNGYCGACTGYQLWAVNLFNGYIGFNGNGAFDTLKNKIPAYDVSVTVFPGEYKGGSYTIEQICNIINDSNSDGHMTYTVFGFHTGSSSYAGQTYGHVLLVHSIYNGNVYWCESFGSSTRVASISSFARTYATSGVVFKFDGAISYGAFGGYDPYLKNDDSQEFNDTLPINLGEEFYAYIRHRSEDMYLTNQDGNIEGCDFTGNNNQIWRFNRQSNGAYSISSTNNNACMDVLLGETLEGGANVYANGNGFTGGENQEFYIYHTYDAHYFSPVHTHGTHMLDMNTSTHNLEMWQAGQDWAPQEFDISIIQEINGKTPINLGKEFCAYIRQQSENVYLTNQDGNIQGEEYTGSRNQIWRFTRRASGAYSISSIANNACMDVLGEATEGGTNVYAYGDGYVGGSNQEFYIYKMYDAYYFSPVYTHGSYMLDMSTSTHNLEMWQTGQDWAPQEFDISIISEINGVIPTNLGKEFYAYIRQQSENVYLTSREGNIQGEPFTGGNVQIWRFDRQASGAYSISSRHDNACMDVLGESTEDGSNVYAYSGGYVGGSNQEFYVYRMYDAYYFSPAHTHGTHMLDMNTTTHNLEMWQAGQDWAPQEFDITTVSIPGKPNIAISATDDLQPVMIQWDATENTEAYGVHIFNDNDDQLFEQRVLETTFAALLQAGAYKVEITSLNDTYNTWNGSGRQSFTVGYADISGMGGLIAKDVFNGHTYEIFQRATTWLGAKRLAEQNGGYLVTITSQEEQDTVQALMNKCDGCAWIGAESFTNSTMTWVTGEEMTYSHWGTGEPNNSLGVENCALIYADGYWNDTKCDYYGNDMPYYIVEYDTVYGDEMPSGNNSILPNGNYVIAAAADPSYYLDISGSEVTADVGTNVGIWSPSTGVNDWDAWTLQYSDGFYRISQMGQDRSLDVNNASIRQGENVQVTSGNSSSAQKWAISLNPDQGYRLQAKCSGLSLDIEGGKQEDGSNVEQWSAHDGIAQRWVFIPYKPAQTLADGRYILVSSLSDSMVLDVAGDTGDISNETNADIWNDSSLSQYNSFNIEALPNGYYTLTHAESGKLLTALGGGTTYGSNIALYDSNGSTAQEWAITKDGDNDGYVLRVRSSGYAMNVANSEISNGTNVQQWPYNGTKAQTWRFVQAEHQVQYSADGASSVPQTQVKYYRNDMKIAEQTPSRNGYRFAGWDTSSDAQTVVYLPGDVYSVDENLTLYAVWEPFVTGITLDRINARIEKDKTLNLLATVTPSGAGNEDLIWSSSNFNVAVVDEHGVVTAIADGNATITVKSVDGSQSATCRVTVVSPVQLSASIPQTEYPVSFTAKQLNQIYQTLVVTVTYSDGTSSSVSNYQWKDDHSPYGFVNETIEAEPTDYYFVITYAGLEAPLTLTLVQPVTGVTLDKTGVMLDKGDTLKLTATVAPSDASNKRVNWSSSDESVATVSTTGTVTAKANGTTTITATTEDGGKTATCEVTVRTPVMGVSLDKINATIEKGKTLTLTATVAPMDASNKSVTWTSSDINIATVSSTGVVTAKANGMVTISATTVDGGKTAACTVTVKTSVIDVTLDKTNVTIEKGETLMLTAMVIPSDASNKSLLWSSSDTNVVTVSNTGVVTAKENGTTTITATSIDGGKTASCEIAVTTSVIYVTLSKTSATIEMGNTLSLSATVIPSDASNRRVTWSSSDTNVATVSDDGTVIAMAEGTVTITVQTMDGGYNCDCAISVTLPKLKEPDFMLPEALKEIEEEAFAGLSMTVVRCPEDIKAIGDRAFANCESLMQIYIPESCTSISKTAFEGCDNALTIFGKEDTAAEMYAKLYGFSFVEAE